MLLPVPFYLHMDSSKSRGASGDGKRRAHPTANEAAEAYSAPSQTLAQVIADELRWLPRRMGGWRGMALFAVFLAILGYMFPTAMGFSFLDPHILLAYACSSPFFVSSVAVESFADARDFAPPRVMLAGKTIAATAFGWAASVLALGLALTSVNLREWHGSAVLPDARFLAGVLGLGLALSAFTVAAAAVLTLRLPAYQAKTILRRAFFIALVSVVLLARYGEVEWRDSLTGMLAPGSILRIATVAMLVFFAAAGGLLAVASRHPRYSGEFPRS